MHLKDFLKKNISSESGQALEGWKQLLFFGGGAFMETQSAEGSHQRCADGGEKKTCLMHRCLEVRPVFPAWVT